ncbi:NAD(P)-dependent oxidoreductase [Gracilibacillus caseinilyticus]|uniref:NAD(P)-dependent oxidoreductase n=1 Tax=Gracilibacillus caseinilyticus TaxID=2932256 RepID=A0ABY4F1M5_9BACI|nr:NAD(P)-dependent oxidoreductase [Gracilibacillus caseinilyticus]UOQ49967.1 NAD(P)-dependent oxidoreductase [Gracilibacillus caseinilyticus]
MKKVIIIGGAGTVGEILYNHLTTDYHVLVFDKMVKNETDTHKQMDATNYDEMLEKIPEDTDVIINLLRIDTSNAIENVEAFNQMTDVFFKASYYLMLVAKQFQIAKVIYASSNHATDYYEENGYSNLAREITTKDYPFPKGLYGVLKVASEEAGFIFSLHTELSVINIRIGSVPKDEKKALLKNDRLSRTLLSKQDLVALFTAAIEADVKYGTYYGVSNNTDKPWDISNAIDELGYRPHVNTDQLKSHD